MVQLVVRVAHWMFLTGPLQFPCIVISFPRNIYSRIFNGRGRLEHPDWKLVLGGIRVRCRYLWNEMQIFFGRWNIQQQPTSIWWVKQQQQQPLLGRSLSDWIICLYMWRLFTIDKVTDFDSGRILAISVFKKKVMLCKSVYQKYDFRDFL